MLIPTHTTRHLACCLASIARHERPPDAIVLTCDVDKPEIAELVRAIWPRVAERLGSKTPPFLHTFRPHKGHAALNQVRNNGIRALDQAFTLTDDDGILVVDGDTMLGETTSAGHRREIESGADLITAYRVNLTAEATEPITPEGILACVPPTLADLASPADHEALAKRAQRARRHLRMRRFPLTSPLIKAHKPKILGGHHCTRVRMLRAVNGYDEEFTALGFDDDDFARRFHLADPKADIRIRVRELMAYHLYHDSRLTWTDRERFDKKLTSGLAARGWENPVDQPTPSIVEIPTSPATVTP